MKQLLITIAAVVLGTTTFSAPIYLQLQTPEELKAVRFVQQMENGLFQECISMLDETMKKALQGDKLEDLWKSLEGQFGSFVSIDGTRPQDRGDYLITLVTCRFEKGMLDVKVVLDNENNVAGLFFLPNRPQTKPKEPAYADKSKFTEEETVVVTGDFRLPATLTLPLGTTEPPVLVLVHGSGPNDRDETIGPNKVFRDLAWGLAMRGIASLRYEKRTIRYRGKLDNINLTPREETIDDAISATHLVARDSRFDGKHVVVAGHSLGGSLAPLIAKEASEVDGIIIMAGPTRPLLEMVREQIEHILKLDGNLSESDIEQLAELDSNTAKLKKGKPTEGLLAGITKRYLDALNTIDGPGEAKKLSIPILVTQGKRDYQVNVEKDFTKWQTILKNNTNVTFMLHDNLDHLFMEGEGISSPIDYQAPRNVSEEFIEHLADWIHKLPPQARSLDK